MFHCPVGVWVIEEHAIILSATVRSPAVLPPFSIYMHMAWYPCGVPNECHYRDIPCLQKRTILYRL